MKRYLVLVLFLFMSVSGLFADDARVMPARIGRLYIAPTFAFANGGYNSDWKYNSYGSGEGSLKAFNLGFALEYGIIDWITAAVQWAPGVTIASDVDQKLPYVDTSGSPPAPGLSDSKVNANGLADIFVGAKFLLLGDNAVFPVLKDKIRFSLATGVKAPLPGQDFADQYKNAVNGDTVTAVNGDTHTLGIGVRAYFDYIVNEKFFINLYSEFIGYPIKRNARDAGYAEYMAIRGTEETLYYITGQSGTARWIDTDINVQYGYDLTFELEPVFMTPIGNKGVVLGAGLPLNYYTNPGKTYDITFARKGDKAAYQWLYEKNLKEAGGGNSSSTFSIKPNVSLFMTEWLLPVEFKLQYGLPLIGHNSMAAHTLNLQIKAYFKI